MERMTHTVFADEKGSALLIVVIIGFLIAAGSMVTFISTRNSTQTISARREKVSAFNIAEAGKEHALAWMRSDSIAFVAGAGQPLFTNLPFGKGNYTVTFDVNTAIDTVTIHSTGILEDSKAKIDVVCALNAEYEHINPSINAAVTARSDVNVTGNTTIDGRDWNSNATSVVGDGVYGIQSCSNISRGGNASIGGRGQSPSKSTTTFNTNPLVSSVGYPTTPEEVLGLAPGALDKYKTATLPSMPFHGIVYYTAAGSFNSPDFQNSTGIFICHNSSRTAEMKNINGNFTGLIISDRVDHINANSKITGAVVTLSDVSGTNAFGNGNSNIYYSSEVISNLTTTFAFASDTTVEVVAWNQSE